jgi:hypothetical protein
MLGYNSIKLFQLVSLHSIQESSGDFPIQNILILKSKYFIINFISQNDKLNIKIIL